MLVFGFQIEPELVQELISAWLLPHFHLVYWLRRDLNPQPLDRELSLLTTRCTNALTKFLVLQKGKNTKRRSLRISMSSSRRPIVKSFVLN
jgi:hypothetical protein